MNSSTGNKAIDAAETYNRMSQTGSEVLNLEESQDYPGNALVSTSSNHSQSTTDGHDTVSTPPTSTSDGISSQATNQDGLSQLSQLSQLAAAQEPMTSTHVVRPTLDIPPTAGQKRTADGQVKPPSPEAAQGSQVRGHSRTTSTISNISTASSRIGELSSELRTRLSYAMVKVNNGWQSNSIDEVESLASQTGSPTSSSTSTLQGRRNIIASPRTTIASIQGQTRATGVPIGGDFDLYSRSEPVSRTYESFWRDHSTNNPAHRAPSPAPRASLAPSADINSISISRRNNAPKFSKPPGLSGKGSNSSGHNSMPRTPNREPNSESKTMQTPMQKTIQEQDAIETLLFMSSPGNSHHFPPGTRTSQTSPQQSPLRTEFTHHDRDRALQRGIVGIDKVATTAGSSEAYAHTAKAASSAKRKDAIERLLDEMGDSSDEEEIIPNYSSPRRVTAGRV